MKYSSNKFTYVWDSANENIKTETKDGRLVREDAPVRNLRLGDDDTIQSDPIPFTLTDLKRASEGIEELIEYPIVDDNGKVLVEPPAWQPDEDE